MKSKHNTMGAAAFILLMLERKDTPPVSGDLFITDNNDFFITDSTNSDNLITDG